jgi:hypothetical protein
MYTLRCQVKSFFVTIHLKSIEIIKNIIAPKLW